MMHSSTMSSSQHHDLTIIMITTFICIFSIGFMYLARLTCPFTVPCHCSIQGPSIQAGGLSVLKVTHPPPHHPTYTHPHMYTLIYVPSYLDSFSLTYALTFTPPTFTTSPSHPNIHIYPISLVRSSLRWTMRSYERPPRESSSPSSTPPRCTRSSPKNR